jgi:hypothetical protein
MMATPAIPGGPVKYLSCAETARLIRAALKQAFPEVKFSVRSSTYANGASIRIGYNSGRLWAKDVKAITDQYAGGRFDSSIDMAFNVEHFLNPDGSADIAYSPGSTGSGGGYASAHGDARPGAIRVSFGADYVFVTNDFRHNACQRCTDNGRDYACQCYWESYGERVDHQDMPWNA